MAPHQDKNWRAASRDFSSFLHYKKPPPFLFFNSFVMIDTGRQLDKFPPCQTRLHASKLTLPPLGLLSDPYMLQFSHRMCSRTSVCCHVNSHQELRTCLLIDILKATTISSDDVSYIRDFGEIQQMPSAFVWRGGVWSQPRRCQKSDRP
jgi:hypothetical protein